MSTTENLIKLVNEALEEAISLDEKIVSKKALRRKRRAARKQAKKQQAQAQNTEQSTETSQETEQETKRDDFVAGPPAIIYEEQPDVQQDYEQISESFTKLINALNELMEKHKKEIEDAMQKWASAGKDQPCPQDTWEEMYQSITTFKTDVENTLNSIDITTIAAPEAVILDRYLTGLNGYIEKAYDQIMAVKPNLCEDDFKAPTTTKSTEVTNTTGTALATTTGTELTTLENPEQELDNMAKDVEKKKDKKAKFVSYDAFQKMYNGLHDLFLQLRDALGKILKAIVAGSLKTLLGIASFAGNWITDQLLSLLTSPVAQDMIKTFMYINPLTAMLIDGKFGKIGLDVGKQVDWLRSKSKEFFAKGKKFIGWPSLEKPENYTKRCFPKDLRQMTLRDLRNNINGSIPMTSLINVAVNHPDVKIEDKGKITGYLQHIEEGFNNKDPQKVRTNFTALLKVLNNVCDYMNWETPKQWERLTPLLVLRRNNAATKQEIDKRASKVKDADKDLNDEHTQQALDNTEKMQKAGVTQQDFDNWLATKSQQESFNVELLEKLLEEAQR